MAKEIKNVIVDSNIECSQPNLHPIGRFSKHTPEDDDKELREWAEEFNEFLREHRGKNGFSVYVRTERKNICSRCGSEWETYKDDGVEYCSSCGDPVEVM